MTNTIKRSAIPLNTKFMRYFIGRHKNILGTILGFTTTLDATIDNKSAYTNIRNEAIQEIKDQGNGQNLKIAYLIFYDHRKGRVDRYMLNFNEPFDVVIRELDDTKFNEHISDYTNQPLTSKDNLQINENILIKDFFVSLRSNKVYKFLYREDTKIHGYSLKNYKDMFQFDGKLNKKFVMRFVTFVCSQIHMATDYSYSKLFDINVINSILNRMSDLNMRILKEGSPNNIEILECMHDKPYIMNIPLDFYKMMEPHNSLYLNAFNIKFEPYYKADVPQVIKDLRAQLDIKSVKNIKELDERIMKFNLLNRIKLLERLSEYQNSKLI